ncbi:hypothetical protein BY996DRAFT_7888714 [Phakopsora pachyrhizi]|uniref:COP9 signalosome complex subunit 6 n=1 Tax=Phakopsora pachyrhizi TaxID=170000 RepID=A0AAV0BSJ2_PHAPC|nr:hypothetical protein BY996DRAFT_7888714 [Phakopsora pachyrhizi]CAH7689782.1 hypothetical protein PPACK8108_LOCUS24919 [Phakopsora pachyrhizi]
MINKSTGDLEILDQSSISDLRIIIHPLPILNISDHLTRDKLKLQSVEKKLPGVGILIGVQVGRKLEIVNSFEVLINCEKNSSSRQADENEDILIDQEFLITRQEQFKQVFPNLDCLGYYLIDDDLKPTDRCLKIQHQLIQNFENLFSNSNLLLLYNPQLLSNSNSKNSVDDMDDVKNIQHQSLKQQQDVVVGSYESCSKDLGMRVFEFIKLQSNYQSCRFEIESSEVEQIAVDHIAKPSISSKDNSSGLLENLMTQRSAIVMFQSRLRVILSYLNQIVKQKVENINCSSKDRVGDDDQMETDQVPVVDHEVLRQISSLLSCLPNSDLKDEFNKEFDSEFNDSLLCSYLSSQTETLNKLNQFVDRILYSKSKDNRMISTGLGISSSSTINKEVQTTADGLVNFSSEKFSDFSTGKSVSNNKALLFPFERSGKLKK